MHSQGSKRALLPPEAAKSAHTCSKGRQPKVFVTSSHSAAAPGTVTVSALSGGSSVPWWPRLRTACRVYSISRHWHPRRHWDARSAHAHDHKINTCRNRFLSIKKENTQWFI